MCWAVLKLFESTGSGVSQLPLHTLWLALVSLYNNYKLTLLDSLTDVTVLFLSEVSLPSDQTQVAGAGPRVGPKLLEGVVPRSQAPCHP